MAYVKQQDSLPLWKPFAMGIMSVALCRLLHLWLSEPVAWGIGGFVTVVAFYESPPRSGRPNLGATLLLAAATGLILFLLTKFL